MSPTLENFSCDRKYGSLLHAGGKVPLAAQLEIDLAELGQHLARRLHMDDCGTQFRVVSTIAINSQGSLQVSRR